MRKPEQEFEALMAVAELNDAARSMLLSPEDRARLEEAGWDVTSDHWGDPVARAPFDVMYSGAALHVALLDVMGEEGAAAAVALWRLGAVQAARDLRDASLAEALKRIRR